MAFLTGQSWRVHKSWYTGPGPKQGFWHCFPDLLEFSLIWGAAVVTLEISQSGSYVPHGILNWVI